MSAIFGRVHFDGRPISPSELRAMQEAMAYWGEDGEGLWREGPVGLGQLQRDSTPESRWEELPWKCSESGDVITASARLDNRDELLEVLSIEPARRARLPDSRLILDAYHRWGRDCVDHLVGDWAFAIWNAREHELFLARDHHGTSSLYYYTDDRSFQFASSIKGLLALPEVPRRPNPLAVAQVLVAWAEHGEETCYEGILGLPPSHRMTVSSQGIRVERYWYLEDTPELHLSSDDEYVAAFLEVYTEAVRCRLRCQTPVAATLSGGLDSGSVTVLAARELRKRGERLTSFSSVPVSDTTGLTGNSFGDETPYIEATAHFSGNIDVNFIHATDVSPLQGIERALFVHDQPNHGVGNMFWIASLLNRARERGFGAVLTGQGGNSTVSWTGGLEPPAIEHLLRGRPVVFAKRLRAWQRTHDRPWGITIRSQVVRPVLTPIRQRLRPANGTEAWSSYSAIHPDFARELDLAAHMKQRGHDPTFSGIRDPHEARLNLIKPGRHLGGALWTEIGAAHGLEIRDPTFDKRVISLCWSIPRNQYSRDGKPKLLIRRAMNGLMPEPVLWNPRIGRQAADIGQRVVDQNTAVSAAIRELEGCALARRYLDLEKMSGVLESLERKIDSRNTSQCSTILMRGLMVGRFLQRFE